MLGTGAGRPAYAPRGPATGLTYIPRPRNARDGDGDGPTRLTREAARGGIRLQLSGIATHLPQISIHAPVGDLTVSEEGGRIVAIDWGWGRDQAATPLLLAARAWLEAYFDGDPSPADFDLAPPCGTPYQRRIWTALLTIPRGQTRTYAQIAETAGGSPRSVGMANGANPIPILIPCHRVVASAGPGGYSGGDGLSTKMFLLALEGAPTASFDQPCLPALA